MSAKDPEVDKRLQSVYGARTRDDLEAGYDAWAENYDQDATDFFGWRGPELAFERFKRLVPQDARNKMLD